MKEIIRVKCPSCKQLLSIPAEWAERAIKCKHCGHAMQAKRRSPSSSQSNKETPQSFPSTPVPVVAPIATPIPVAKVPKAVPVASPVSPTAGAGWDGKALPEFTPPPAAMKPTVAPLPVEIPSRPQTTYVSAFDTRNKHTGKGRKYKGPKSGQWLKFAILGLIFCGLLGGGGFLYFKKPELFMPPGIDPDKDANIAENKAGTPAVSHVAGADLSSGVFPRRMLAISIHNYLYANPLHNGESNFANDDSKRTGTDAAIRKLAERWRIPNEQIFHLTDAPTRAERMASKQPKKAGDAVEVARPAKNIPLKMVMEGAIASFAESCREQDRVVIVFCGHAFEKGGKTFLVPLEGDFDEMDSLIPLEWFFEKVGACKAQEKLVIFDVCRFHPDRGIERPHPGVMSEALEKALHGSPDNVSVVTTCSKGEYSYELDYLHNKAIKSDIYGGFFLSMIHAAGVEGFLTPGGKLLAPTDPLPEERLVAFMTEKMPEIVKDQFGDKTQTVKATIKRSDNSVKYDPNEPLAAKVNYPVPPPSADPKLISSILREIEVPSVKSFREDTVQTKVSDVVPFKLEKLKEYEQGNLKKDDKPNPFQKAVLTAVEEMRKLREAGNGNELPESFVGETSDAAKNQLKRVQEVPAKVEVILREQLDELETVGAMKDTQSKRWQAHYDYVLAQVKFRICYANQYNMALANVRGGKVPDLKADQNGFRLTAETTLDKNTSKEYKVMFDEAKKALNEIVKNHAQTPWALLAKADRTVAIGLRLTPANVR